MIRALTFEQIHNRKNIGSTRLRIHQLFKYWPEAGIYKYGENPDVLIFQKVYMTPDYRLHEHFKGLKILDICDPDWLEGTYIKQTVDAVDGITCPTKALADFIRQLTDKPVKVIPDRHIVDGLSAPKKHTGQLSKAVWFGYKHNVKTLQFVIPVLESRGIALTLISDDDPVVWRWANDPDQFKANYRFKKFDAETIIEDLQQSDVCLLPIGNRPRDRFKSDNKATLAYLAGLPVVMNLEELNAMREPGTRNAEASKNYARAIKEYDVRLSVEELKQFIEELG